jgi:hypothetical protein
MADPAGYSGTPLAQKLGLKDGQRVLFIGLPEPLRDLAGAKKFAAVRHCRWQGLAAAGGGFDLVHGFTTLRSELEGAARLLMDAIRRDGAVWISWPKKAARVATDITEDTVRQVLLPTGLVDVKVAAIDAVWSGLKMMIRKELR